MVINNGFSTNGNMMNILPKNKHFNIRTFSTILRLIIQLVRS
jgi:hypothetical protein